MLKSLKADLHIHTCLSPCGDLKMSPANIAEKANIQNIDILGICDHNSAENVPAVMQAASRYKITVLPGLEVTSQEEIHILALFDELLFALKMQEVIYNNLPGENDEDAFGIQVVVNEAGEVLDFNKRLLIGASTLSVNEVVETIHNLNGLAIAAHIDRESFSLISQLGFIPPDLDLDALEISWRMDTQEAMERFRPDVSITRSSDAHFPEEIGRATTTFLIEQATTKEIKKALFGQEGRKLIH
ncbi:MAG: PHP domain-containing protein [Candidatus Aminicenantes bacterium]|nr:PHP domain-containing protein [Candidatus Aminicenantes bacterium]